MTRTRSTLALALGVATIIGFTGSTATAQVAVATCTVSTTSAVAFGSYSVFNGSPTDTAGALTYVCTGASGSVSISLTGVQPSGTRLLKNGSSVLAYHVFTDAARTRPWGDGTFGAAAATFSKPPDNTPVRAVMYGRIFARQDVSFGVYSDSLVASINF